MENLVKMLHCSDLSILQTVTLTNIGCLPADFGLTFNEVVLWECFVEALDGRLLTLPLSDIISGLNMTSGSNKLLWEIK